MKTITQAPETVRPRSRPLQGALAETQGALQPLAPFLDSLRWLFVAAVLTGPPGPPC
jgi:hypothetical protein